MHRSLIPIQMEAMWVMLLSPPNPMLARLSRPAPKHDHGASRLVSYPFMSMCSSNVLVVRGFDQMFGASAAEIMSLGIDRHVEFDQSGRPKVPINTILILVLSVSFKLNLLLVLQKRTKRLGDGVRRTKKLDEKLVRLMGEANSDYLQGKLEAVRLVYSVCTILISICVSCRACCLLQAAEILLEVIKLAPEHQPAFQTLGMIYEDSGDRQKALDIYMIAADLNSRDVDQWKRLSAMANEVGNRDQELHCLNKLIRLLPDNSDVLFKRAMLYKVPTFSQISCSFHFSSSLTEKY
jgi:hypothetical protein